MELRTLGYFVAVAETGSVSAAAAVVHVAQPAISRQVRQLETELGVELFARSAGRLRLSAAGRQFLPHAQDVLRRADGARNAARSYAAGRLERITIAAPTTTLTDVIAPFLATLGPDDPMPTVIESDPREAYDALWHGADLAIATDPAGQRGTRGAAGVGVRTGRSCVARPRIGTSEGARDRDRPRPDAGIQATADPRPRDGARRGVTGAPRGL